NAEHGAEQRITIPATLSLRDVTVFLWPPVPAGALEARVQSRNGTRSATASLAHTSADGVLSFRFSPLPVQEGEQIVVRLTVRDAQESIVLRTATGVTEDMTSAVRIGNATRDRSLALSLGTHRPLGTRLLTVLQPTGTALRAIDANTLGLALLGATIGVGLYIVLRQPLSSQRFWTLCLGAAALSFLLHQPFLRSYPATNDEGSILADAVHLSPEFWPLQTGGAKGPLSLLALAPLVRAVEHPLLAGRQVIALLTGIEVVLLGIAARRLWNERAGVVSAVLYAVTPAVIAQTTQVFLQPFALPFVTLGWILLMPSHAPSSRRYLLRIALAGSCFALGFLARPTSLAFAPAAFLVFLLLPRQPWSQRLRALLLAGIGFLLVIAIAGGIAVPLLGVEKTVDLFGWQGFLVSQQRAEIGRVPRSLTELDAVLQYAWPLFVGALPVLLLGGAFILQSVAAGIRLPLRAAVFLYTISAALVLALALRLPAISSPSILHGAVLGGSLLVFFLALAHAIKQHNNSPRAQALRDLLLLCGTWIVLVVGYANYGRFRLHYHAEFLPLYVIASAFLIETLFVRIPAHGRSSAREVWNIVPVALLGAVLALSFPTTYARYHAGNIPLSVADAVAADLRERTAPTEGVFTAQVLFPVLAHRRVPYGIAHPGWYREEALGMLPRGLRAQYYPDRDALRRAIETTPIRIIVIERRTREVFLEFDPELRRLIDQRYRLVRTVDNPLVDAIEIWERLSSTP
ncbi:MAG: hypothetical protein G01um1014106_595, partial [Parcubacteria group bacterium Gr01-1014_106]